MNSIKIIKFTLLLIITLLFFSDTHLFAQQRQGPPKLPNESQIAKMISDMTVKLSLTENQSAQVKELFTDHFAEVKASLGNKNGQRKSREEMESLRTDFQDDVKSLLNDEQQELFDEFMKKNDKQSKGEQKPRR